MEFVELVRGAQESMSRGDYRLATAAGSHGLTSHPSSLVLHRLLGESHLELGETEPAIKHFAQTLQIDPLNVIARLGLGVAAEGRKDLPQAYSHYLSAWETNPGLEQVRDELVRLRNLLGAGDRLHPTRAGLAGIYTRSGQFQRAVNEWRALLATDPENPRLRSAYAELLWRQGDDAGAATACQEALKVTPDNARVLAMLADIERRRKGTGADEYAARYRVVDPTGELLSVLSDWRPDVDLSFLLSEVSEIDEFDFDSHVAVQPREVASKPPSVAEVVNQIAAPDLWDTLVKDLASDGPKLDFPTATAGSGPTGWPHNNQVMEEDAFAEFSIAPFRLEEPTGDEPAATESTIDEAITSTADLQAAIPNEQMAVEPAAWFAEEPPAIPPAEEHFKIAEAREASGWTDILSAAIPADALPGEHPELDDAALLAVLGGDGLDLQPFSLDEEPLPAFNAPNEAPAEAMAQPLTQPVPVEAVATPQAIAADESSAVEDRDEEAAPPAIPAFDDPFVSADGKIDLTAGWDDLDKTLAAATPNFDDAAELDALAAELGMDGIAPFEVESSTGDDSAWEPLGLDEFDTTPATVTAMPEAIADPVGEAPSNFSEFDILEAGFAAADDTSVQDAPAPLDLSVFDLTSAQSDDLVIDIAARASAPADTDDWELWTNTDAPDVSDAASMDSEPAAGSLLDRTLVREIPGQSASGYTEILRDIDTEEPIDLSEAPDEIDPFANPDATGQPLDFEELLAATSRDGTAPLVAPSSAIWETTNEAETLPVAELSATPEEPTAADTPLFIDDGGLEDDFSLLGAEPFSFDDGDLALASLDVVAGVASDGLAIEAPDGGWLGDQGTATGIESPNSVVDDEQLSAIAPDAEAEELADLDELAGLELFSLDEEAAPTWPDAIVGDMTAAPVEGDVEAPAVASAEDVSTTPDRADAMSEIPGVVPFELAELDLSETSHNHVANGSDDTLFGVEPFSFDELNNLPGANGAAADALHFGQSGDFGLADEGSLADVASDERVASLESLGLDIISPLADRVRSLTADLASTLSQEPAASGPQPVGTAGNDQAAGQPSWSGAGGLGVTPAAVLWPAFISQTSSLMNRDESGGGLFARLRLNRQSAMSGGALTVDRRLNSISAKPTAAPGPLEQVEVAVSATPTPERAPAPVMSEQARMDLMTMRLRLLDEPAAAGEIAEQLEQAIAQGMSDPLAMRVLGEAYLKLGKVEQAAAMFRQAMLARQRGKG